MKKNKVVIHLMGRDYTLLTDEDAAQVQRLARYVGGVCGRRGGAVIVSGRAQATQLVFYVLEINNVHFCCFK